MSSPSGTDVIIVNYRCAGQTCRAAGMLDNWPGTIWVVDNSAEGSEAARLEAALARQRNTRLLVAERNLGFGAGCNLAYAQSRAAYVLLLNPDACIEPSAVERLVAALDASPRLAAVAPAIYWDDERCFLLPTLMPEEPIWWLMRVFASRWPRAIGRAIAHAYLNWQLRLHSANSPQPVRYLSGAVLLLRRRAVDAAGGLFDPRYFMFYEDADLSRRLRQAGLDLALLPTAHAQHAWRNRPEKSALMARSATVYHRQHFPALCRLASLWRGADAAPLEPFAAPSDRHPGYWGLGRLLTSPISSLDELDGRLGRRSILAISPSPVGFPALFRPNLITAKFAKEHWQALDAGRYLCLTWDGAAREWVAFDKAWVV